MQKATILQEVIDKIQERMDELARIEAEKAEQESENEYELNLDAENLEDYVGPLGDQDQNAQSRKDLRDGEAGEDFWLVQNALKVDRIKNKIDGDAKRQKRAKSAGEMALLFMGINKIAYDLLLENPMTGYMNEIIFTRVLGIDDIYQGGVWKDTSQCWVCEKWDKTKIKYDEKDKKLFAQNINKLKDLDEVIKECVKVQNEHLIKKVPESEVKIMFEEDEDEEEEVKFGADMLKSGDRKSPQIKEEEAESYESIETATEDKIYTESLHSSFAELNMDIEMGDPINPIRVSKQAIERQMPRLQKKKDLEHNASQFELEGEESDIEEYKKLKTPEKVRRGQIVPDAPESTKPQKPTSKLTKKMKSTMQQEELKVNIADLQNEVKDEFDGDNFYDDQSMQKARDASSGLGFKSKTMKPGELRIGESVKDDISESTFQGEEMDFGKKTSNSPMGAQFTGLLDKEKLQPQAKKQMTPVKEEEEERLCEHGKKMKKVVKQIFFQGTVFLVEEEVSVHSSEEIEMETSDDEFSTDNEGVIEGYNAKIKEMEENKPPEQKLRDDMLQQLLDKNVNKHLNLFGRKQIYVCASFNEWMPIEMQTTAEIKQRKDKHEDTLKEMDPKKLAKLAKSKKKEENMIQFCNFVPPGRHYFYFMYQNQYLFLSPNYDVVRFKKTNVFLNQVMVHERNEGLKQVTLQRSVYTTEALKFDKSKSIWKNYQEDEPDHLKKCLDQDLQYGKLFRVAKEDYGLLQKTLFGDYLVLKNIFMYLAAKSSYPVIGWNDYSLFVNRSKLPDKKLIVAEIDRALISTNYTVNKYKNSAEKELHRYEFVEIIVRLSIVKYVQNKTAANMVEAYKMIREEIIPRNG